MTVIPMVLRYVCVLRTIWSLVVLNLGHRVTHISCPLLVFSVFFILVDLHSQKCINTLLFELVVRCIKTHIFFLTFLISNIFISIIKFFCCLLLLGQIFTWNIQYYTTLIQNHIYSTFEQIFSFSCFIFTHMRIQRVTLTTRKGVFILRMPG